MASLRNLAVLLLGALQLQPAPVLAAPFEKQVVPGKYIVQLKKGISAPDVDTHLSWVRDVHSRRSLNSRDIFGVQKTFRINDFNAYAGEFDEETLEQIRGNPDILRIEENQIFTLIDGPGVSSPSPSASAEKQKRDLVTQDDAVWGLGAISHREPGSTQYVYDSSAGEGTWGYVIDSGVRTTHEQFEGRAVAAYNALEGAEDDDNMGHGTHVSATVAGATVGVARKASIVGIKVFDSNVATTTQDVLDAFSWAVDDIVSKGRQDKAVINMSLGGGRSDAFDDAVNSAFAAGIISTVAAGNFNEDASTWSPASAADALTVGAVASDWTRWYASNFGAVLDIFAPGADVTSAGIASDTALVSDSGTSMAAPHVAGVALYLQALEGGSAADIVKRILDLAGEGVVEDPSGSPNLMLYNGNAA